MPHRVSYWACIYCKNPYSDEYEAKVCEEHHESRNDSWYRQYKHKKESHT